VPTKEEKLLDGRVHAGAESVDRVNAWNDDMGKTQSLTVVNCNKT